MLSLAIVIPVHNEEDHIVPCLEAIAEQSIMPSEVIVVDNNCTDSTIHLAEQFDFVRIVRQPKQGIAHARNAGFDAVTSDIIGRIDADTRLPETWVEDAIGYIADHPDELITGGSYFYDLPLPHFTGWVQGQLAFRANRFIIGHYIAWGSNMAFRRELWRSVRREVHNDRQIHEDIDLGMHLHEHGYKIHYDPNWKVGIESRVYSPLRRTREQQMRYLKMWPNTLYKHNLRRAWLGTVGAYIVYYTYVPLLIAHYLRATKRWLQTTTDEI